MVTPVKPPPAVAVRTPVVTAAAVAECVPTPDVSQAAECKDNAYYHVGLSSRTSYAIDDAAHNALVELGRLTVRLHREELLALLESRAKR